MKTLVRGICATLILSASAVYGGSCIVSGSTLRPTAGTVDIKTKTLETAFDSKLGKAGDSMMDTAFSSSVFHPVGLTLQEGFSSCRVGFLLLLW